MGCQMSSPPHFGRNEDSTSGPINTVAFTNKNVSPETAVDSQNKQNETPDKPEDKHKQLLRPLTKKSAIVPHNRIFQIVDQHAKHTPLEMASNIDRLVTYLMSSCTNTLNMVRMFYMWITTHIRYDHSPVSTVELNKFEPYVILKSGQASLVNINLLFHYFCQRTSIPCVLIHGVLKTTNKAPTSLLRYKTRSNHVWSMVLVQEQWRFIDCACGGGYLDDNKLQDRIRDFFFLPDPEDLILTHFPLGMSNEEINHQTVLVGPKEVPVEVKEGLQMLDTPLKFGQFCQLAVTSIVATQIGLDLTSHANAHVTVDKGERFAFQTQALLNVAAVLTEKSAKVEHLHSILCTRKGDSEFRVFVKPKCKGDYKLTVYGQLKSTDDDSFHRLVDYFLTVDEVEDNFVPFPEHFGVWGANKYAPEFGFSKRIFKFDVLSCRTGDLYIKLPVSHFTRTKSVVAPACDDEDDTGLLSESSPRRSCSTLTQYTEGVVHIKARFPDTGFFALSLLAQSHEVVSDASTTFINIADFVINCLSPSTFIAPYPKSFPVTQNYHCLLLEPLTRELVVNQTVTFRLQSALLSNVKIEGELMTRHEENEHVWCLDYTPTCPGAALYIYGCGGSGKGLSSLSALYMFSVVDIDEEVTTVSTHM